MAAISWVGMQKKYKGKWVALKKDEKTVIASGKTAKDALNAAKKKGVGRPILAHMPQRLLTYVG
jgi:ribonuclease BN (tRNA processing enzyme)